LTQERSGNGNEQPPPAGTGSLLRNGWRGLRANPATLIGIFAAASAAVIITTVAANLISYAAGRPLVVVVLLEQIVPFFALGVFFGAAMAASAGVLSEPAHKPHLISALNSTRPMTKDLLAAGIVAGMVMVTAVTLLYYLPLLFLPLFFGPPVVVHLIAIDRLRFSEAMARARDLTAGERLRAVGALLPAAFLAGAVTYAAPNAVAAATDPLGDVVRQAATIVTRIGIDAIAIAFFAAVVYALFVDIKARRDPPATEPERDKRAARPERQRKARRR
jgi:hypothetical protein